LDEEKRSELKSGEDNDLGTFHFLRAGWWIWHVIAIAGIFYLGWLWGGRVF
jgi:hypothetical protein